MRPLPHPFLFDGRTGDPAPYVETLFEKRVSMFDLVDLVDLGGAASRGCRADCRRDR
jgi:hypothetical protein